MTLYCSAKEKWELSKSVGKVSFEPRSFHSFLRKSCKSQQLSALQHISRWPCRVSVCLFWVLTRFRALRRSCSVPSRRSFFFGWQRAQRMSTLHTLNSHKIHISFFRRTVWCSRAVRALFCWNSEPRDDDECVARPTNVDISYNSQKVKYVAKKKDHWHSKIARREALNNNFSYTSHECVCVISTKPLVPSLLAQKREIENYQKLQHCCVCVDSSELDWMGKDLISSSKNEHSTHIYTTAAIHVKVTRPKIISNSEKLIAICQARECAARLTNWRHCQLSFGKTFFFLDISLNRQQ